MKNMDAVPSYFGVPGRVIKYYDKRVQDFYLTNGSMLWSSFRSLGIPKSSGETWLPCGCKAVFVFFAFPEIYESITLTQCISHRVLT